jgi:hypothetical protein
MSDAFPGNELGIIIDRTKGLLLTEETVQDAVHALAEVARDVMTGAEGAGVSLIRDGERISVGATDAKVREADVLQYSLGEGVLPQRLGNKPTHQPC